MGFSTCNRTYLPPSHILPRALRAHAPGLYVVVAVAYVADVKGCFELVFERRRWKKDKMWAERVGKVCVFSGRLN